MKVRPKLLVCLFVLACLLGGVAIANSSSNILDFLPGFLKPPPPFALFSYRDLGNLGHKSGQNPWATAQAISNNGQVTGYSSTNGDYYHAFRWTPADGLQDLGTAPGYSYFEGHGINDKGWVAGRCLDTGSNIRAFLWTPGGGIQPLGTLGGQNSEAYGINNNGQIVGMSDIANPSWIRHAFLWSGGSMADLKTLGGPGCTTCGSAAYGLNRNGWVAGESSTNQGYTHPFVMIGGMKDLGTLGEPALEGYAQAINDNCWVVGYSGVHLGQQGEHAFLWTQAGGMEDLGTLGGNYSWAYGINNKGIVVGASHLEGAGQSAFVWTREWGMIDLNWLVVDLPEGVGLAAATAINDSGQIVGDTAGGAFLLTPIQE